MFNICKHKWEVLQDITLKSKLELLLDEAGKCPYPSNTYQMEQLTARKHITTFVCKECGKIKRYVEKI